MTEPGRETPPAAQRDKKLVLFFGAVVLLAAAAFFVFAGVSQMIAIQNVPADAAGAPNADAAKEPDSER